MIEIGPNIKSIIAIRALYPEGYPTLIDKILSNKEYCPKCPHKILFAQEEVKGD